MLHEFIKISFGQAMEPQRNCEFGSWIQIFCVPEDGSKAKKSLSVFWILRFMECLKKYVFVKHPDASRIMIWP